MSLCADLEDLCTCFYLLYSFVLIKVILVEIRFAVLHVFTLFLQHQLNPFTTLINRGAHNITTLINETNWYVKGGYI